ncbi:SDR family oxidoreductase [Microbacterium sp. NIBRBAC000506063]|uniref:SDR family oxidoreductase n=1 Tax=Microbacterium sp. NIBRBAC000506063 TaxID=2734618 RepID=UPI001BB6A524|nr:SDR family oxidoreductase [Microbacterium sp. NIBRBAC000506063]QTV79553.1 SDR family oxidoreductase [Microbacterium sp. NIBRBAC000506063]
MDIAIAGGTGVLGSAVATVAEGRGHRVRVLSRSKGVDVETGEGLADAVGGADALVDALSVQTTSAKRAEAFFATTTRALQEAARAGGVAHHVVPSIVGVDRVPYGYYAGKLAQERAVEAGEVPWTILRATQFHEFASQLFERAAVGPLRLAVKMRTQPVAVREVAERLVDLVEAGPAGRAPDFAGPREESMVEMMRAWAARSGYDGRMPAIALPGAFGRAMRDGSVLPGLDADHGTVTFEEWLQAQPTR